MNMSWGSRTKQRLQNTLGFVSVTALMCLCGPIQVAAQPAAPSEDKTEASPSAPPPAPPANAPGAGANQAAPASTSPSPTMSQPPLPTVSVESHRRRPPRQAAPAPRTRTAAPVRARSVPAQAPAEQTRSSAFQPVATNAGGGSTIGYVGTSTSTATKTNTPLINVPQSVSVLTREFIRDQNFQSLGEAVRYVPGVIPHQGEGNRDDVVIRGQRSNADFFVNGIRDDVQYYRDLYNISRIEVLKGPNAMIFGRGGGGGVINRVLKEADGEPVRELTLQGGQFNNKRAVIDVGGAVTPSVAARFNAVYENSDSYRDFVTLERYGINPTVTLLPNDSTKVQLSYEYFHDRRTTDRGIPSQFGRPYPTAPSTFFGNPDLNYANVDAHIGTAVVEHETDAGLKIKNASRVADYEKFYQNIFPGGAVNAAGTSVNLSAYNNQTDRQNLFNQTDLTYKLDFGLVKHTLLWGAEVGRQSGLSYRQSGFFNNVSTSLPVSPLNPVTFVPVTFRNIASDANNTYRLNLAATYLQDQIEITRYLQLIAGVRFDRFDLQSQDRRNGATFERVDDLVSPRAGVVIKPLENVSLYGSYSVSYLPGSGDQFSTLAPGTVIAEPEKFVNKEVGAKWEVSPRLQFTTALYDLVRTNQRLADPNNPGFFILSGATRTKGFEAGASGYITAAWQMQGGYAYTDARIASDTSATIRAGNRVGLVPYHTFSWWNKYQLTELWAFGVGVIRQTDSYASSDDTVVLPGFTRIDAAVFGRFNKNVRWQINVENLFDQGYIATADGNNNITPGSPRAVRGTVIASF
jgi:catecholate siderophore receptor